MCLRANNVCNGSNAEIWTDNFPKTIQKFFCTVNGLYAVKIPRCVCL